MDARRAWEAAGKPNGEKAVQNIRKRGAALRKQEAEGPTEDEAVVAIAVEVGPGKGNAVRGWRLTTGQLAKEQAAETKRKEAFNAAYIAATNEWQLMVCTGGVGKNDRSSNGVAARYNATLPPGAKQLTGRMLRNALLQGRCGRAPEAPGPKRVIPDALVQSVADLAILRQAAGDEQQPRQLAQAAMAAVKGTRFEDNLRTPSQRAHFLARVREKSGIKVAKSEAVDDRRWQYLTTTKLSTWFEGYFECLQTHGFIDPEVEMPMAGGVIEIPKEKARRMINGDETHQKLSNEGEKSGPRATVYVNPELGRAGKRTVTQQKHATTMVWCNYAGEVGAPHLMLATDAAAAKKGKSSHGADAANIRTRPEWLFGVPRVIGKFGHETEQTFEPSFIMNEKGGMEGGGFEQFVEKQIYPAYPNLSKDWEFAEDGTVIKGPVFAQFDAGPDRYSEISLDFRIKAYDRGLILFPGLCNGTAANQLCDDLFGPYKTACDTVMDEIVAERMLAKHNDPTVKASGGAGYRRGGGRGGHCV